MLVYQTHLHNNNSVSEWEPVQIYILATILLYMLLTCIYICIENINLRLQECFLKNLQNFKQGLIYKQWRCLPCKLFEKLKMWKDMHTLKYFKFCWQNNEVEKNNYVR